MFDTKTYGIHAFYNKKFSAQSSMKIGVQATQYNYTLVDSALNFNPTSNLFWKFSTRWNSNGTAFMLIPYVQWKYKYSPAFTISTGIQMQTYTVNYDPSNTPLARTAMAGDVKYSNTSNSGPLLRFGARYQATKRDAINLGLGMHSQNQSAYVYYYQKPGNNTPHNLGMGLSKSNHAVLGWDHQMGKASRIKVETYYQALSNLPVEMLMASNNYKGSSFSLANTGSGFSRFFPDSLQNTGKGYNYGIEFTVEKFFSKGFYYLASLSLFDAQYQGSDNVWRSSDFNTNYAANGLIAREFVFKNKNSLNIGGKMTFAGARRFSPIDTMATIYEREYIEKSSLKNTQRFGTAYQRFDFSVVRQLMQEGKSVQLMAAHQFNWEYVNYVIPGQIPGPYYFVYRTIQSSIFNKLFLFLRTRQGGKPVAAEAFAAARDQIFAQPAALILGADQNPSHPDRAIWIEFFGKATPFHPGPAKGAIAKNTAMVMLNLARKKRGYYHLDATLITRDCANYTPEQLTWLYKKETERLILENPSNYLWSHRRWRHQWQPSYGPVYKGE